MNKLRSLFNQNITRIVLAVIAIAFLIGVIQVFNKNAKIELAKKEEERQYNLIEEQNNNTKQNPTQSVISSGGSISQETASSSQQLIQDFVRYCNNKDVNSAYSLLSESCKECMYPSINEFKNNYWALNFNTPKMCTIKLWITGSLTYQIQLFDDVMATGSIDEGMRVQDYFTVVTDEKGQIKLNISEYIGREQINKTQTVSNIIFTINYKDTYKEYEIFNVTVQNKTGKTINLDSEESTQKIYVLGKNDTKYKAFRNEIRNRDLIIRSSFKSTFNIKFNIEYTQKSKNNEKSIIFEDVILDQEEYEKTQSKVKYTNRTKIEVKL